MSSAVDLKAKVLELSKAERAELARELILSLEPADSHSDIEAAWESEVLKRLDAIDRGEATLSDWREAVDRVKQNLRRD